MSTRRQQSNGRHIHIERPHGEPLTRRDLQFDVLSHIFNDEHAVFTDPIHPGCKLSFSQLYINAILSSTKTTKAHRDKMLESPLFAAEFAKIALLANVGRLSSSMAFFPEVRTRSRTFHPVPALSHASGNLQDVPRLKSLLNNVPPTSESPPPTTPPDVLSQARAGITPPTSVANVVYLMAQNSFAIGQTHFASDLEFIDLFLPVHISSESRSTAFLWLMYHYLEAFVPGQPSNPFGASKHEEQLPHQLPPLQQLSEEEFEAENIDTAEDREAALRINEKREQSLLHQEAQMTAKAELDEIVVNMPAKTTSNARTRKRIKPDQSAIAIERSRTASPPFQDSQARAPSPLRELNHHRAGSPWEPTTLNPDLRFPGRPNRTMVEYARRVIRTLDPLLDSDDELGTEDDREEYTRRLHILTRLQGRH